MKKLRLVFFGTPEFAVPMLENLLASSHEVVAVVTAPDKPAGRGMEVQPSEVKLCALRHGLKLLQPEKLKDENFLTELRRLQADLFVVVAFRMLPEVVWNMPPLGSINLHASLLPNYRGAAPIHWVIINGEKQTGVTTFFLRHEIDTGDIIFQEKIDLDEEETAGTLYKKLMDLGVVVLKKTVDAIASGDYPKIPQAQTSDIKKAPKIFKSDCLMNFRKSCAELNNFVRGLSPYPAAHFYLHNKLIKVFKAKAEMADHQHVPGDCLSDGKTFLKIACSDGYLQLLEVQMEGKKRMDITTFLRGFSVISQC
jgi:methionyl-tRNA formyltransferase